MNTYSITQNDMASALEPWSLRMAATVHNADDGRQAAHYFLLLAGDAGTILDELHFKPVKAHEGWSEDPEGLYERPLRPDIELLGAEAYVKNNRTLDSVDSVTYAQSQADEIIHLWNGAFSIARIITNFRHPFGPGYNCRTAAEAVLVSLGFEIKPFAYWQKSEWKPTALSRDVGIYKHPPLQDLEGLAATFQSHHEIINRGRDPVNIYVRGAPVFR